jgi:hypothetical protein
VVFEITLLSAANIATKSRMPSSSPAKIKKKN